MGSLSRRVFLCVGLFGSITLAQGVRGRGRLRSSAGDAGPRPLWTYWGSPSPPVLVNLCVETLRYHTGHDWEVHVLSKASALEHVAKNDLPPAFASMRPSFQADALRLALLRRHGGMWIDATTIATRNFSDWVGRAFEGGSTFYGFYIEHYTAQGGPPLVASWAIAVSGAEDPLMKAWHNAYLRLWRNRSTADDIVEDKFFAGVDISNVNPFMRDYLNVELVLQALLQRDSALRSKFDDSATVMSAEVGPYAIQTVLGMSWMGGSRCRPVTAALTSLPVELRKELAATPLVKLRHQDRKHMEKMSASQLLGHKDSVIGSLLLHNGASTVAPALLNVADEGGC